MSSVTGSSGLTSLDGSNSVSVSLSCPSSVNFLKVSYVPVSGGNINVFIREDLDLDGNFDYSYEIDGVAGVCASGLLFCDPGTLNNCKYAPYIVDSAGKVKMGTLSPFDPKMNNTGVSCYCINSACNNMSLAPEGMSKILDDISGVVLSLISSVLDIAGISVSKDLSSIEIVVSASKASDCLSGGDANSDFSRIKSYYQDGSDVALNTAVDEVLTGQKDYPIQGATQDFPKAYEYTSNSPYLKGTPPPAERYCSIVTNARVKLVDSGNCDFNYTCTGVEDNGDGYFKCYLPSTGSSGCGPVFEYQFCGRYHTWTDICDDACAIVKHDGVEVWKPICEKTDDTDPWSGSYTGDAGGSLTQVYIYYRDTGGCSCADYVTNNSGLYVYIKDFPEYNVVNNCTVIENSPDDCSLDTEIICEPDAVCTSFESCVNNPSCVVTVRGGSRTGKSIGSTCKFLDGTLTGTVLCMNGNTVTTAGNQVLATGEDLWWKAYRKYTCKNDQQYEYDIDLSKQKETLDSTNYNESTGEFSYKDFKGNNVSGIIKSYGTGCVEYCRVKVSPSPDSYNEGELVSAKTSSDSQNSSAHVKGDTEYVTYKECNEGVCPLNSNETQLTPCSCMSDQPADFSGLISLYTVYESTKDIICSSSPP
ncbi:hypothetical protein [Persephonella sp. KM09-Lau-8]|uniref:hypothetical protein n=1 Tax=Persephonella sp. KM09-Lau-8 TaxID=1158345 RepID=UPI0012DE436A|nr:hypothetical protein [Persephonella sp. KM09-Lau-8]